VSVPSDQATGRVYDRFQLIVNGSALFNAIVTALDLDIYGFLARNGGATFAEIRDFTGLAAHKLRILMLALCTTELVGGQDGRYVLASAAEELLVRDTPESWRDTLLGWRRFQYPAFPELTAALRSGANAALAAYPGEGPTLYHRLAMDPAAEKSYHDSIAPFTHLFLPALLDNEEFASVGHLLDVGGGDGTTAVGFARRYPRASVTVFEFPTVAERASSMLPTDVAGRVAFCPGDFFTDPFPDNVDAVMFSHVLEPFSPEENAGLLKKARECLPSGGKIFAYGTTASDDEDGGPLAARLSLFLNVLASGAGMAYPVKDYAQWLIDAGCRTVRSFRGLPFEHGLVVGIKE
jgi:hypothetical protein